MAAKGRTFCHVEKNLKALEEFPRVALNNIRDFPEAFKPVGVIFVGRSLLSASLASNDESYEAGKMSERSSSSEYIYNIRCNI